MINKTHIHKNMGIYGFIHINTGQFCGQLLFVYLFLLHFVDSCGFIFLSEATHVSHFLSVGCLFF